jgi:guanylate kinase
MTMRDSTAPTARPLLIVLSAPSGGGKTTLMEGMLAANPALTRAVTCTTRAPRGREKNGVDYIFLGADDFLKRVQAGNFLEHATVYGNSYGTLKAEVLGKLRRGKDVLLAVDVQGAASIRAAAEQDAELAEALVTVFLTPPTLKVLEERLRKRNQDSKDSIRRRLAVSRQEIAQWRNFDYLILSSSIAEDIRRMQAIYDAERMRRTRVKPLRIQPE